MRFNNLTRPTAPREIPTGRKGDTGAQGPQGIQGEKGDPGSGLAELVGLVGDGSTTEFTITHGFDTFDVVVEVFRNSGERDTIITDVSRPSLNTVKLSFKVAPSIAEFAYILRASRETSE